MQRLSLKFHINPFLLAIFFLALLLVGSAAFGLIVDHVVFIQNFDRYFYELAINGPHPAWLNALVSPFNFSFLPLLPSVFLSFLVIAVLLLLGVIFYIKRKDFGWAIFAVLLGFGLDQAIAYVLPAIVFRPRPFTVLPNTLNTAFIQIWNVWPSFPSGHTRDTAIFMTILAAFMPKKFRWLLALFAIFIAWTRVYLGAHYPTDVIAGLLIGYLMGKITLLFVEEIRLLREQKKI